MVASPVASSPIWPSVVNNKPQTNTSIQMRKSSNLQRQQLPVKHLNQREADILIDARRKNALVFFPRPGTIPLIWAVVMAICLKGISLINTEPLPLSWIREKYELTERRVLVYLQNAAKISMLARCSLSRCKHYAQCGSRCCTNILQRECGLSPRPKPALVTWFSSSVNWVCVGRNIL